MDVFFEQWTPVRSIPIEKGITTHVLVPSPGSTVSVVHAAVLGVVVLLRRAGKLGSSALRVLYKTRSFTAPGSVSIVRKKFT